MGDEQMTQEQKGKTPVLDVQNLTKIYDNGGKGDGNEVLKNVNFTMNEGEICLHPGTVRMWKDYVSSLHRRF